MRRPFVRVVSRIFPPEAGAASLRLGAVVDELARQRVATEVVTTTVPLSHGDSGTGRATIRRLPVLRDAKGYVRGYAAYVSFDVQALFAQIFSSSRPAVSLIEPPPTTLVAARLASWVNGVPYVVYLPDVWSRAARACSPRWVATALELMETWALKGAEATIAINEEVALFANKHGARRVHVVPNGIDTDLFTPCGPRLTSSQRHRVGLSEAPYVLYMGTANSWHGADVFIRALARVRDHIADHLVYLGRGDQWAQLRGLAREYGLSDRVHFVDAVPAEEAACYMRGASAAAVSLKPGSGYEFAYPTKLFAATSAGVPALYAGVGDAYTDVRDERLGVAAAHDPRAVAEAWCRLGDGVWEGERLRAWTQRHRSASACAASVCEILREVAAEARMH